MKLAKLVPNVTRVSVVPVFYVQAKNKLSTLSNMPCRTFLITKCFKITVFGPKIYKNAWIDSKAIFKIKMDV